MLNLFSLKDKKQEEAAAGGNAAGGGNAKSRVSAAQIRITKDINELELPKTCTLDPDPNDLLSFQLIISPDEGFYRAGRFTFQFKITFRKSCLTVTCVHNKNVCGCFGVVSAKNA